MGCTQYGSNFPLDLASMRSLGSMDWGVHDTSTGPSVVPTSGAPPSLIIPTTSIMHSSAPATSTPGFFVRVSSSSGNSSDGDADPNQTDTTVHREHITATGRADLTMRDMAVQLNNSEDTPTPKQQALICWQGMVRVFEPPVSSPSPSTTSGTSNSPGSRKRQAAVAELSVSISQCKKAKNLALSSSYVNLASPGTIAEQSMDASDSSAASSTSSGTRKRRQDPSPQDSIQRACKKSCRKQVVATDQPPGFNGQHFSFLPFGSDRRMCPDILLAQRVVSLTIASLVYHFDWKLPHSTNELDMNAIFGIKLLQATTLLAVPMNFRKGITCQTE
ncbi:hypothetical protein RJ640_026008 [Escallonia rubra]|uniref:Uncharacterized protein n=1 Tax=Escallonia rubra TaxID=112253 RepID=A0AA88USL4_9ASTE|nr:hypothetical protein RJ640_026008 [Escallonia rubra]